MKKLKKLLATMNAGVMCAVSLTPFVSNAKIGGWQYAPDQTVNDYTVSFTVNGEKKYILWQEASDYYKFDEKDREFYSYSSNGTTVTCYDGGMNVYITEEPCADGDYGLYGCYYRYYRNEDGTTHSLFETCPFSFDAYFLKNETDKKALENYLIDNNISYGKYGDDRIYIRLDKGATVYDYMNVFNDIKENTGFKVGWSLLETASQASDIEYALPEKTLDGDANEDGEVNIADATAIIQYIGNADKYGLTMQGRANADCYNTGDGVTGMDAMAIQKLEAGLIKSLDEA